MKSIFTGPPVTLTVPHLASTCGVEARGLSSVRVYAIERAEASPELIGSVTMPRWPADAELRAMNNRQRLHFSLDAVTFHVYEDLYFLHRALSHVLERFETDEVPRLTTALEHCHALHGVVLGLRKDTYEELISQIEQLADAVVEAIGLRATNAAKERVLEHVIKTRPGTDSLNRVNSGVACLRMLTAVGSLITRESQVSSIAQVYAVRRQAVRLALASLETLVLIVEDYLRQSLEKWQTVCIRRRELTIAQLDHFISVLEPVVVKPFGATFQHVVREFRAAAEHIRAGRLDLAKPLLVTSAESLQLRRLRVDLERVHYRVASAAHDKRLRHKFRDNIPGLLAELDPLVMELSVMDTRGMVDFDRDNILANLSKVEDAIANARWVAAADTFRLALSLI